MDSLESKHRPQARSYLSTVGGHPKISRVEMPTELMYPDPRKRELSNLGNMIKKAARNSVFLSDLD